MVITIFYFKPRYYIMQSKKIISFIFIFFSLFSFSQVKIGQWLDHLSYSNTNSVSKVESKVYVSNGVGLAVFDERDNRIRKLTKIDGLSDVGIKLLRKNDNNNLLLVIYENTNIDVIKPNDEKDEIVNIADNKNSCFLTNVIRKYLFQTETVKQNQLLNKTTLKHC